jgi:hypothetical protein
LLNARLSATSGGGARWMEVEKKAEEEGEAAEERRVRAQGVGGQI